MLIRRTMIVAIAALSLSFAASPASAQTEQNGLVNVNVSDVILQLPVGVAANVCDVNANVLARQLRTGDATCDAVAMSDADAA